MWTLSVRDRRLINEACEVIHLFPGGVPLLVSTAVRRFFLAVGVSFLVFFVSSGGGGLRCLCFFIHRLVRFFHIEFGDVGFLEGGMLLRDVFNCSLVMFS